MRLFVAIVLSLSVLLTSCTSLPTTRSSTICPTLRGGITFCLLKPSQLPTGEARNMVRIKQGDKTSTFIGVLSITDKMLSLHGLSPMGLQLFQLQYDGYDIHFSSPVSVLPESTLSKSELPNPNIPRPDLLIALLQLMMADIQLLNQKLVGDAVITQNEAGTQRLLRSGDNKIIIIRRRGDRDLKTGYSVSIPAADLQVELQALQ